MSVLLTFVANDPQISLIVNDDDTVAYGYILVNDEIQSDVWLYNCQNPPNMPPWRVKGEAPPFLNPIEFAAPKYFTPIAGTTDISVVWDYDSMSNLIGAKIFKRSNYHARITPDSKPGWCILAIKDGPLAKTLVIEEI